MTTQPQPVGDTEPMVFRRATGELEEAVLRFVWAMDAPVTPAEAHESVAPDLAYTTVMTVLTRLHQKGRLERERRGRAYAYWAPDGEASHRAGQMRNQLSSADNSDAVLSSFVEKLSGAEAAELRRLLADLESS
jgi:predicted transcriptional regulator|tara:strand:- start:397 stop:798 length:402 start_codon:yes stop_codon:yes gene_type:complete